MKKPFCFHHIVLVGLLLLLTSARPSLADEVINDDYILDGSLCVGSGCEDGENFGFSTIILKQNDPRLASESAGNFTNWFIVNAASSNGGINSFSIADAGSGTSLFTLDAGAPDHSIYVHESGRLGIGTNNPTCKLHVEGGAFFSGAMEVASSRELKDSIMDMEAEESRKALKGLQPVKFNYKIDPSEESLGFIAEDMPSIAATNSRKTINPIDVITVLTRVIQEQQRAIKDLTGRIYDLEKIRAKTKTPCKGDRI